MKKYCIFILSVLLFYMAGCGAPSTDVLDIHVELSTESGQKTVEVPAQTPAATALPESSGTSASPETTLAGTTHASGGLGVTEPVRTADAATIQSELSIHIAAPAGADTLAYSIIENSIAQLEFRMEGVTYTYRIAKTAGEEDISGLSTNFESEERLEYAGIEYRVRYTKGNTGLVLWYDHLTSHSYSLFMQNSAQLETLQRMTEALLSQ